MAILLTGGAGYIGSHTAVELIENGYDVIIADNFSNSDYGVVENIGKITGKIPKSYMTDISDKSGLRRIFEENRIEAAVHFAGYKAVGESVRKPVMYYRNNIDATLTLLETMDEFGVKRIVFSSSATVYGANNPVPYIEEMTTGGCSNPYGWTKFMIEQILKDVCTADDRMSAVLLRYFNPIGAHSSGLIGERPRGIPNNLMPYITQTAAGIRNKLSVFGNDYPTPDGTGVRDYIHVSDLAVAHRKAIEYSKNHRGAEAINLGTGKGLSVLQIINAFENVNGIKLNYEFAPRREGDIAECYAGTDKAKALLGWTAEKSVEDMCRDSWRWESGSKSGK